MLLPASIPVWTEDRVPTGRFVTAATMAVIGHSKSELLPDGCTGQLLGRTAHGRWVVISRCMCPDGEAIVAVVISAPQAAAWCATQGMDLPPELAPDSPEMEV